MILNGIRNRHVQFGLVQNEFWPNYCNSPIWIDKNYQINGRTNSFFVKVTYGTQLV